MTDVRLALPSAEVRLRGRIGHHAPRLPAIGRLPSLALAAAIVLLVIVPLLALLDTALEGGPMALAGAVASAGPSIWASAWTSLAAATLAVGIGGLLAFLTERARVAGRQGLRALMLLAFIVPGYVAALGWLNAYGPGGLLDDALGLGAAAVVGPLGIVLVLGVEAAPVAYLIIAAGLATRAEPDLERAARASGAGAMTVLRTITLPLMAPVLAGASAIAFVLSLTSFGVPAVLGAPAGFTTMTTRIYRDLAFSSDPAAFSRAVGLALVLALGAFLAIRIADALLARRGQDRSGAPMGPGGTAAGPTLPRSRGSRDRRSLGLRMLAGVLAWGAVVLVVVVPLLALVVTALARAPGLPPVPASWSLDNLEAVLGPRTWRALGNSVVLALAAAVGVMALSGLAVLALRGRSSRSGRGTPNGRAARSTGAILGAAFGLPGSTLAVAVMLGYGLALRDTLAIILVAYLAKFWALGYRPLAAGLAAIPADSFHAARASGAGPLATARTIALPLLRPLVVAGGLIVLMFGLHEVTMSSLLHGPGTTTLAVVVLDLQQLGDAGQTAALALVMTVVVTLVALPLARFPGLVGRAGWGG